MIRNSRGDDILELVNSNGSISVKELAERTYTSPSTVRRELRKLEEMGLLRRHHGSAQSILTMRPPQIIRRQYNQDEKKEIAKNAAQMLTADSTVFIDASTTVQYMIPHIATVPNITVYTNGADTAMQLAEAKIRVICTGGNLLPESMAYVGAVASDTVRKVYFDAMFFSSAAFDDGIISDWSEQETALRRIVMEQSAKKYFLADRTKKGKRYTHVVCRLTEVDKIFCE